MGITERISRIFMLWFIREETFYAASCTHNIVKVNNSMKCPIRVGKGVIEIHADLCAGMTDKELEERLRVEMIRILLKHPYDRQPDGCSKLACALASNCVIADAYPLKYIKMEHPEDFGLPKNKHYEYYARCIQRLLQTDDPSEENEDEDSEGHEMNEYQKEGIADIAEKWEQDDLMAAQINESIKKVRSWGSMPGKLMEQIVASTKARIDYRKVLAGFRATILSQQRQLTRMRPNRRSGFQQMGSRHQFSTKLIIGVDVSGSITSEDLSHFYSTINRFFKYGIQQIDVVQFDAELGQVETLKKASKIVKIKGRGGTNFQPFIDFVARNPQYDGALIYTDGYAAQPDIPSTMRTPICWVLRSEEELKTHEAWMRKSGKVCMIENN